MDESVEFIYAPRGTFSLARTSARFVRLPDPVSRVGDGQFARLVPAGRGLVLVRVTQEGPVSRARLRVRIDGRGASTDAARVTALRVVERVLGAAADLRPFTRALGGDPLLGPAIAAHRGVRVSGTFDLFEALVNAVLTQQINLQFAYSIRGELARAFGRSAKIGGESWLAFPAAARMATLSEGDLAGFRLSAAKIATLLRVARACADGTLDESALQRLSDEDAITELVRVKGIGRWTAEVTLIRGLGRLDVFPAGDLVIVKRLGPQWLDASASERDVRAFAARWSPFRSLALIYLFEELSALAASRKKARSDSPRRSSRTRRPSA